MQRILQYTIVFINMTMIHSGRIPVQSFITKSIPTFQLKIPSEKYVCRKRRRLSTHDLSQHDDTQNCNFAQVGTNLGKAAQAKYCSWRSCCSRGRSIGSKKRIFHGAVRRKDAILELVPVDLLTRQKQQPQLLWQQWKPRFRKQVAAASGSFQKMTHKTVSLLQLE